MLFDNLNLIYKEVNTMRTISRYNNNELITHELINSAKKSIVRAKFIFPELMMIHLFLTKKDLHKHVQKSFSVSTSERKIHIQRAFPNQSQLMTIRSLMYILLYISNLQIDKSKSFSDIMKLPGSNEVFPQHCFNPLFNGEDVFKSKNSLEKKAYHLNEYLKNLYLSENEMADLFVRLSSYFLFLKKLESKSSNDRIFPLYKPFKKDERLKGAYELYYFLFKSKRVNPEFNLINSYSLITNENKLKHNRSLKFYYIKRNRIYHTLIWEDKYKPKYLLYGYGFYSALYTLFSFVDKNHVRFSAENMKNFNCVYLDMFLIYIAAEQIFNSNIRSKTDK